MHFKNNFYPILVASCVQNRKICSHVTMLQDETKLCNSTVLGTLFLRCIRALVKNAVCLYVHGAPFAALHPRTCHHTSL
jgi:hypothetical protein